MKKFYYLVFLVILFFMSNLHSAHADSADDIFLNKQPLDLLMNDGAPSKKERCKGHAKVILKVKDEIKKLEQELKSCGSSNNPLITNPQEYWIDKVFNNKSNSSKSNPCDSLKSKIKKEEAILSKALSKL